MKKFLCSLLAIGLLSAQAQDNDYKKKPTLILNLTGFDFKTSQAIRNSSVGAVIRDKKWSKVKDMSLGFGLSYLKGLNNNIDMMASINGAFVKYPFREKASYNNEKLLVEADVVANIKLLSDKYCVVPYFTAGVGASKYASMYGAYIPVGLGIQVKLIEGTYFITNAQYRLPVSQEANYHFVYSIGFGSSLSDGKTEPVLKPLPVVPEAIAPSAVPSVMAPKDTDGDGIADDKDNCATVAGSAKYMGCPVPDTDKDGINDEEDKCPNQAGVARQAGCPVPDTDGDGINDEKDKCPTDAGLPVNQGCPQKEILQASVTETIKKEINTAAKNIFFETGKATLLKKSNAALTDVVNILIDNETVKMEIEGHTDNTGNAKANLTLSQNRADAVLAYFLKKGITKDRIIAKGYGITKPIASNKTPTGRARNRRVVMNVVL